MVNCESKVSDACEYAVKLRVFIWEYPDTGRQLNLSVAAMIINLDMSLVLDFVIYDGPFFGRYITRWVVLWMLYGLMDCFRDFYGAIGGILDVVWYDLRFAKKHYERRRTDKPPTVTSFRFVFEL